jgi:hypothetical protein
MVNVSQTKVGAGLQFLWKSDSGELIYCSVDLVPSFNIQGIEPLELANIINSAMLSKRPEGWFDYMRKYAKADLIVAELLEGDKSQTIESVLLKNLNCSEETNYFVRPGQHLSESKFTSDVHKAIYTKIKALKTILKVDVNNYFVKKLLLRKVEYGDSVIVDYIFFFEVMQQPELREMFKSRIDYEVWIEDLDKTYIPLWTEEELLRLNTQDRTRGPRPILEDVIVTEIDGRNQPAVRRWPISSTTSLQPRRLVTERGRNST